MERTWAAMQKLSREDLIAEYDREAKTVGVWGLDFIRGQIFQQDLQAQGDRMEDMTHQMTSMTKQIKWLTVVIAVMTAVSTWAVLRGR